MKQLEFMNRLDIGIRSLSYDERREILTDYEEHFARGKEAGQSEDEICEALGDPDAIAREYIRPDASNGASANKAFGNGANHAGSQGNGAAYGNGQRGASQAQNDTGQGRQYGANGQSQQRPPVYPPYNPGQPETPDWAKALIAIAVIMINVFIVAPIWLGFAGAIFGIAVAFVALAVAGCALIAMCAAQFILLFAGICLLSLGALGFIGVCYAVKYFAIGTSMYIKMNGKLIKEGRI